MESRYESMFDFLGRERKRLLEVIVKEHPSLSFLSEERKYMIVEYDDRYILITSNRKLANRIAEILGEPKVSLVGGPRIEDQYYTYRWDIMKVKCPKCMSKNVEMRRWYLEEDSSRTVYYHCRSCGETFSMKFK
jgi:DNA-directed RNA polymerase subunit M/transcription elongation factor TFIIS